MSSRRLLLASSNATTALLRAANGRPPAPRLATELERDAARSLPGRPVRPRWFRLRARRRYRRELRRYLRAVHVFELERELGVYAAASAPPVRGRLT